MLDSLAALLAACLFVWFLAWLLGWLVGGCLAGYLPGWYVTNCVKFVLKYHSNLNTNYLFHWYK